LNTLSPSSPSSIIITLDNGGNKKTTLISSGTAHSDNNDEGINKTQPLQLVL
jgi:hypothetical protein